jgi:hypothetical protein
VPTSPSPKQTLPIIVVKCQSLDLITPGNKEHGWWLTNEDKRTIAGKGPLNPNQFSIKFLSEMYIIGLGWNFNMCCWYRVYIYVGEGLKGEKMSHIQNAEYILFYFIFGYRPMDVVLCVNIFWIWENVFFPLSFFHLCSHKHKVNLPTNPWGGEGWTRRTCFRCFLFFHKLSHPSIILYLVLPKLFEDACACVQHLDRAKLMHSYHSWLEWVTSELYGSLLPFSWVVVVLCSSFCLLSWFISMKFHNQRSIT